MTLLVIIFILFNYVIERLFAGVVISGLIFIVLIYVIHILTQYEGPWGYAQYQYYIHHVPERRLNRTERFYAFTIQIQIIQLLIFIE